MSSITQSESKSRLQAVKKLLEDGKLGTQEELCEALEQKKFSVTQSTVSRDLRRLGAIKITNPSGAIVYRLPSNEILAAASAVSVSTGLKDLLSEITHNGSMIVIRTPPGSASLVAHHLDLSKPKGILGTIAGDDTIFVAPRLVKQIDATMKAIIEEFSS